MPLHTDRAGAGPRIVLVHGFTQTSRCWGPEAALLERDHEVVRVDAPGHGRSQDVRANLTAAASLLGAAGGSATYLGYSMGARLCLTLAVTDPALVRGLVLIGGTAGIEDEHDRAARHAQDLDTAARLRTQGLKLFLEEWLAQPIFAGLPPAGAFRAERLANDEAGLASSLELAGTGAQVPVWDRLGGLHMPVLIVTGARDEKFTEIGHRLAHAIGSSATLVVVPDAGHAVHLEQPDVFAGALQHWLAEHEL